MNTARHSCEACGSDDFFYRHYGNHLERGNRRGSWRQKLAGKARFLLDPLQPLLPHIHQKTLWLSEFKVQVCEICGHGKFLRQLRTEWLRLYYEKLYWQAGGKTEDDPADFQKSNRAHGQYLFVEKPLKNAGSEWITLEIGAASAHFSQLLRFHHPHMKVSVIEVGLGWKDYYKKRNIQHIGDYFPVKTDLKFNYIHTSHWLEHVISIQEALPALYDLLVEDGFLFVEIPHCPREYWNLDIGDIPHVHFFSTSSIRKAAERNRFQIIQLDTFGASIVEEYESSKGIRSVSQDWEHSESKNIPRTQGGVIRCLLKKMKS